MANFTITRQTESSDNYGCTNFDTNQIEGEMASLTNGDPLDGSIIWYLDANAGYTVSVDDFEIPGTTPTSAAQTPGTYRTFEGSGIPSPVLGIVFDQITVTRIRITLYLHPIAQHQITGSVFTMPSNSVSANINIEGCANEEGEGVNLRISNPEGEDYVVTTSTVSSEVKDTLSTTAIADGVIINGFVSKAKRDQELVSYTLTAKEGKQFGTIPILNLGTSDYYTKFTTTKNEDGAITSITFNIFKTI